MTFPITPVSHRRQSLRFRHDGVCNCVCREFLFLVGVHVVIAQVDREFS